MRAPNVTLDIYIAPNAPPATPDTAGAVGCLIPRFRPGQEANEGSRTFLWDHLLEVSLGTDIRDTYPGAPSQQIFIPHTNVPGLGQDFLVVFVEKVTHFHTPRGKSFKRVYLKRGNFKEPTVPLTIREADGTPSYSTAQVLEVNQASGFTLSEPVPNEVRLDLDMPTLIAAMGLQLDDLADVSLGAPNAGDVLTFDGTDWVNSPPASGNSFVGCRVFYGSTLSVSSGSFVSIPFDNEFFDVGGFHDNGTDPERFTIPTGLAGYYRITGKVCWEGFDGFVQAQLYKVTGATVLTLDAGTNTTSGYFQSFFVNAVAYLAEGDIVEFQVYQETGSNKDVYGGSAMSYFEIEFLGGS